MLSPKSIRIASFPKDNRLWKVDWVGIPKINPAAKSEPLLTAFLTRFKNTTSSVINPLNPSSLEKFHLQVSIGAGHQSLVNTGSVWKNQEQVFQSVEYTELDFNVDTSQAKPITFAEKIGVDKKRILTAFQYPTGKDAFDKIKESPLIAIPYNGDPYGLLIPAIEVIRFYYLLSSPMATAVYYGVFEKLTVPTPEFDPVAKQVSFTLNWGVSKNDAWGIARYWSSELVKERVKDIHEWVQKTSINQVEQVCRSTLFPFDDETTLKCQGYFITGEDGINRYLCTKLIECSGPFLFEHVNAQIMKSDVSTEEYEKELANPTVPWPVYDNQSTNTVHTEEEPSKKHIAKQFVNSESRFSGLKNKTKDIEIVKKKSERVAKIYSDSEKKDRKISTSDGTYSDSNTRRAQISTNLDSKPSEPERLKAFVDMLNYLRNVKGMAVRTLAIELPDKFLDKAGYGSVNIGSYMGETIIGCFKVGKKKNAWVDIKIEQYNFKKPRGLIIAEVNYQSKLWYLMELERDASKEKQFFSLFILYKNNNTEIFNDELYDFVYRCGITKGWASVGKGDTAILRKMTLNHASGLGDRVAEKLGC